MAGSPISALALADLLGRWPAADGPLYRLLATRIARLADTGELPAGLAAVDCAPQVAAALSEPETVLTRAGRAALTGTSGYFPYGLPELRAAVAGHLTQGLSLAADPSQVIVTTGGQQAIDLRPACRGYRDPASAVISLVLVKTFLFTS